MDTNEVELALSTDTTAGWEITGVAVYRREDKLNLSAYRCVTVISARWRDEASKRGLSERFYGYGPDFEAADRQAAQGYEHWRMRLNEIDGRYQARKAAR